MPPRNFWPENDADRGRWAEYRYARTAERGTSVRRDAYHDWDRGIRAVMPGGGYQRPSLEGRRAYDPGERGANTMTGQRGMPERSVEEVAAPFDEDAIIERIDQDHRGRGPKGYRRSDQRVAEDINDRLTDDPDIDATDIEVLVKDGEVTLQGMVNSRLARRKAEDLAEDTRGVHYVQNNLRVRVLGRPDAGHTNSPFTTMGHGRTLPTGAGSDASTTSGSGATGMVAGTGTASSGADLLGSEETRGRRYAAAPIDRGE
ncbi:BON domain-containing protein [Benzoatithermus flavus]|uniref:BON domain-containing protein n=1 Tax=Benzoatithermus flavus TaxID=3108223 RepID=A0ABU8XTG4_9PROT